MVEYRSGDGMATGGPPGSRAGFGPRLVAALIDGLLLAVVGGVVRAIFGFTLGALIQLILGLGYYVYLEGSPSGQTLGKRAMSIRVIDAGSAGPIGPARALVRYIGRLISAIPCFLGYLWMLWDKDSQTWHDKMATSLVVPTSEYPVAAWPG
jgi:uncharacterized RDD family membrane protein YckC